MRGRHQVVPDAGVQIAGWGQWAWEVGIGPGPGGTRVQEEGTIQVERRTEGIRDQEGMEEEVRIAVRRVGRSPAGMEVVGGIPELVPVEGLGGGSEAPIQVPDQVFAYPVGFWSAWLAFETQKIILKQRD